MKIMSEFKGTPMDQLKKLMERLRHPTEGCPWDREQTFETVVPYTIEEAYEVEDAIARKDPEAIREELGDLLLQIVFHSRMAEEAGLFNFDAVAKTITSKMIERHPHVFGKESERTQSFHSQAWEDQKTRERKKNNGNSGTLDGVALALPALMRSEKLIKRLKRAGLDPTNIQTLQKKLEETFQEKKDFTESENDGDKINEEWIGQMFFLLSHLAVHLGVDSEKSLRETNRRFETHVEHFEKNITITNDGLFTKTDEDYKSNHPLMYVNFMQDD